MTRLAYPNQWTGDTSFVGGAITCYTYALNNGL